MTVSTGPRSSPNVEQAGVWGALDSARPGDSPVDLEVIPEITGALESLHYGLRSRGEATLSGDRTDSRPEVSASFIGNLAKNLLYKHIHFRSALKQ